MTHTRFALILLLCVIVVAAGCRRRVAPVAAAPPPAPAAAVEPAAPAPLPPPPPAPPAALTEEERFARMSLEELNAERPLGDVFFDLDQAVVREDGRAVLQRNADWLRRWTSTRVTIEGHADDRGTSEYNLALGERRAGATRDYLLSLGIGADRIAIVAMGEEAPACRDPQESCWQQNRRGHFVITAK